MSLPNELEKYDFYGPFQISQDMAFIKHSYVPFNMGSLELAEIIKNKKVALNRELNKWCALEYENNRRLYDS